MHVYYYWTPPSWFHAVNRLETGSQGSVRTSFGSFGFA